MPHSDVPVARLFRAGGNDRLADHLDSELLLESLPAGSLARVARLPDFEHLDFLWGEDAPERVFAGVLQDLRRDAAEWRRWRASGGAAATTAAAAAER